MKPQHLSPLALAVTLAFCAPLQAAQVVPATSILNGQTLSSLDGTLDDRSAEPMSFKALQQIKRFDGTCFDSVDALTIDLRFTKVALTLIKKIEVIFM